MKILGDFPIRKGTHCATSSLSEIMEFNGYKFSEALVLGISGGVEFSYVYSMNKDFPRLIFTRSPMIEFDFFKNLGIDFRWNKERNLSFNEIKSAIDNNQPILALTDTQRLEFFGVTTPSMAYHTLTIIGYNEDDETVKISDMIGSNIFSSDYKSLVNAINIEKPPFFFKNIWSPIEKIKINKSIEELIINGMRINALKMLFPPSEHCGVKALTKLKDEVSEWRKLENYQMSCLHVYLSIEKIGTGGSGFRRMYKEFLEEIPVHTNEINVENLIEKIGFIVDLYSELSENFKLFSKIDDENYIIKIQSILEGIIINETEFWNMVLKAVNSGRYDLVI